MLPVAAESVAGRVIANALNGLHAVLAALEIFPNLKEVIADRGYSIFEEDFVRPLHRLGINVAMDYIDKQRERPRQIEVGRGKHKQTLLLHCGTFFPSWLPKKWHVQPDDLTETAREEWFADRGRLRVETTNSMVKDKGALKLGSCRALGLAADNMALLAHVVAHNLREAKGYAYHKQLLEDNSAQPTPIEPSSTPTRGENNSRAPP